MKQAKEQSEDKYRYLKGNYSQLLASYDQSEELRKVYKQLVNDQASEIQKLRDQVNQQRLSQESPTIQPQLPLQDKPFREYQRKYANYRTINDDD